MALSWRARRRWALVVLVVGLPVYIVVAVNVMELFDRPPFWLELAVYIGLGFVWILPFRGLFRGISRPEPPEEEAARRR